MKKQKTEKTKKRSQNTEAVGQRLVRLREARGMTQAMLARQVGLAQNQMSDFERGRTRLNADAMILIAKALDVTADEIVGLDCKRTKKTLISGPVLRRVALIEALPPSTKKHVLRTIDMLLAGAEMQQRK